MTIDEIINDVYPLTDSVLHSTIEKEFWLYKRERLRKLIEQYKAGELINFKPLNISVNLEELLKRIRN